MQLEPPLLHTFDKSLIRLRSLFLKEGGLYFYLVGHFFLAKMESLLHFGDVFSLFAGQFHLVLGHEKGRFLLVSELLLELLLLNLLFDDG